VAGAVSGGAGLLAGPLGAARAAGCGLVTRPVVVPAYSFVRVATLSHTKQAAAPNVPLRQLIAFTSCDAACVRLCRLLWQVQYLVAQGCCQDRLAA
jgi:hypothetical protein